jgi:hypothetical protein
MAGTRLRHLGGTGRSPAVPLREAVLLGRARPGHPPSATARRREAGRVLEPRAPTDRRGDPDARLERLEAGVYPEVRLGRTRRRGASRSASRVPSSDRRACAFDHRGDRARPPRGGPRAPLPLFDGLRGGEGAFVLCSFWLVSALARAGRRERAERLFDEIVRLANDIGLLAEEVDPRTRRAARQFPAGVLSCWPHHRRLRPRQARLRGAQAIGPRRRAR